MKSFTVALKGHASRVVVPLVLVGTASLGGCVSAGTTMRGLDQQTSRDRSLLVIQQSQTRELQRERHGLESELARLQDERRAVAAQPPSEARSDALAKLDRKIASMQVKIQDASPAL